MSNQVKTLGTISMILGIISLVVFCIPVISLIMAVTGLILGILGIVNAKKTSDSSSSSIAGTIISALAFLIGIVFNLALFGGIKDGFIDDFNWNNNNNYYDFYDDTDTNYTDIDSLLLDDDELNNLNPIMDDEDNGPGPAPD